MSRLVVVSHAINGRGMGHLVRQLAILRWVRLITAWLGTPCDAWVLTSSEADTLARREGFCALKIPSKAMMRDAGLSPERYLAVVRSWVLQTVAGLSPHLLLVDTFPAGSFGELIPVLELARRRVLVARRVKQDFAAEASYQALLPLYHHQVVPDERDVGPILIREHCELLPRAQARSALGIGGDQRAVYLTLGGGGDTAAPSLLPRLLAPLRARGWHVVVGAGPLYMGPELRGAGVTWMDRYMPVELFTGLDAAVSAGGYNSFHELMMAGVPTVFLPQPRIADDQGERVARAVAAGAGRQAGRVEDVPDLLEDPGDSSAARGLVPGNGAREAAFQALDTLIPARDLAQARRVLTPALLPLLSGLAGGLPAASPAALPALDLLRLLARSGPDGVGAEGEVRGVARLRGLLDLLAGCGAPSDLALRLLQDLARKFPAASGEQLHAAAEVLFPLWARFDDWMGAVSLLRAVPTQRGYAVEAFCADLSRWLCREEDLYDALRQLSRREGSGRRPLAEVLAELASAAPGSGA